MYRHTILIHLICVQSLVVQLRGHTSIHTFIISHLNVVTNLININYSTRRLSTISSLSR